MHGTTKCTETPSILLKIDSAYPAIWAVPSNLSGSAYVPIWVAGSLLMTLLLTVRRVGSVAQPVCDLEGVADGIGTEELWSCGEHCRECR